MEADVDAEPTQAEGTYLNLKQFLADFDNGVQFCQLYGRYCQQSLLWLQPRGLNKNIFKAHVP